MEEKIVIIIKLTYSSMFHPELKTYKKKVIVLYDVVLGLYYTCVPRFHVPLAMFCILFYLMSK